MSTAPTTPAAPAVPPSERTVNLNPGWLPWVALLATWGVLLWQHAPAVTLPHVLCWSPCERCMGTLPGPQPPVPPGPTPPPITTALHATLVYDAQNKAEALASEPARGDPGLEAQLAALGCKWRTFDKGAPEVARANLLAYYNQAGGPVLIVQAEGVPKPVAVVKAPKDSAAVLAAVKGARGQ